MSLSPGGYKDLDESVKTDPTWTSEKKEKMEILMRLKKQICCDESVTDHIHGDKGLSQK